MSEKKFSLDLCHGSILWKMIVFVFPLLCTYELQSLFNAADLAIIGRFASHQALAAIGATLNPVTLMLKIFIGLSTGVNAVIALYCGANNHLKFHHGTHTSMAVSLYFGLILTPIALLCAKPLLVLMNTPEDILPDACTYIWIYFLGIPFLIVFNFGCAILRSVGDSRRPMYYLLISGLLNVLLNLLMVAGFKMSVAGVAIATTVSNAVAAGLILRTLVFSTDHCHLNLKKLKIDWQLLKEILWIGIPAGINSSFFNIANMFIQASLNTFGAFAIAGSSATISVESFCSIAASGFQQAVMTFVAQNYGAKKYARTVRCCLVGLFLAGGVTLVLGWALMFAGRPLLLLFSTEPEVIRWGLLRMQVMLTTFFLGAIMDITCGCLRGLGYSMLPTGASLVGACFFRIFWVVAIFPHHRTMQFLLGCYPISWLLVSLFNGIMLYIVLKKIFRQRRAAAVPAA